MLLASIIPPENVFRMYYDIYNGSLFQSIKDIVYINLDALFTDPTVNGVYDGFKIFSMFLIMIYFMIDILGKSTSMQITIDYIMKSFLKILIAVILLNSGMDICRGIISIANSVTSSVTGGISSADNPHFDWEDMWKEIKGYGTFALIGTYLQQAFPWLLILLQKLILYVFCWTRALEIVVRTLVAGPAMADIFSDAGRSGCVRYLKKYTATCLTGVLYIIVVFVGSRLPDIVMRNDFVFHAPDEISAAYMSTYIATQFVVIAALAKAQSWANDLMGVR